MADREHITKIIEAMERTKKELEELYKTNPEKAKKMAREHLQKIGILDEDGNLKPPYNGQKVNEDDFTRGPGEISTLDKDER